MHLKVELYYYTVASMRRGKSWWSLYRKMWSCEEFILLRMGKRSWQWDLTRGWHTSAQWTAKTLQATSSQENNHSSSLHPTKISPRIAARSLPHHTNAQTAFGHNEQSPPASAQALHGSSPREANRHLLWCWHARIACWRPWWTNSSGRCCWSTHPSGRRVSSGGLMS